MSFTTTPPTGVYLGTLQEDMIDTVIETKGQYIKVLVPELFDENGDYPYTYVPDWGMVLPLRKDDKVLIRFDQENIRYPVLYRNPSELDTSFYVEYDLPMDGSLVSFPTKEKTVTGHRFGNNSYIITTDRYTLLRQNDQFVMLKDQAGAWINAKTVNILASSGINIENSSSDASNLIKIGNGSSATLGAYISDLVSKMSDLCTKLSTLTTAGSPTAHTINPTLAGQLSTLSTQLSKLRTDWDKVFK